MICILPGTVILFLVLHRDIHLEYHSQATPGSSLFSDASYTLKPSACELKFSRLGFFPGINLIYKCE